MRQTTDIGQAGGARVFFFFFCTYYMFVMVHFA